MPIHLCSLDRRDFLTLLGGSVVAISAGAERARSKIEDDLVYVLNDTHIGEKQPPDSPVPSHLRQVVDELTGREINPAAVLVNGDLALRDGQPGDYRHLARLLLRQSQIDLHLTLGNHDHREVYYDVLKDERPKEPVVATRHIAVVKTRHANFVLLDSLLGRKNDGKMGRTEKWDGGNIVDIPSVPLSLQYILTQSMISHEDHSRQRFRGNSESLCC